MFSFPDIITLFLTYFTVPTPEMDLRQTFARNREGWLPALTTPHERTNGMGTAIAPKHLHLRNLCQTNLENFSPVTQFIPPSDYLLPRPPYQAALAWSRVGGNVIFYEIKLSAHLPEGATNQFFTRTPTHTHSGP